MTSVRPIPNPARGEDLVAVQPVLAPSADAGWHRHLNIFTGRALTAPALSAEQIGRMGRLAATGQTLSPGVVKGLAASLDDQQTSVIISAGFGLAANGEDVVLPAAVRVALDAIPVYGPVTLFAAPTTAPTASTDRELGPTLGDLRTRAAANPPTASLPPAVGVLVLQPVVAEFAGTFNSANPCEEDPHSFAFENWLSKDGSRLLMYTWPLEWSPLPADSGNTWRNVLANNIFEMERLSAPGPWNAAGVPIALVAFTPGLTAPRFLDRFSVVRAGGKARSRTPLISGLGTPSVWRARLQQFADQLAAAQSSVATINALGTLFRYLPPAGLLPKQALEAGATPGTWLTRFFPNTYRMQAMPVPLEQLDYVLDASAPLAHFDATLASDDVRILVPVAQPWFEPSLLLNETVNPIFQQTLTTALNARATSLQRRSLVRSWVSALMKAVTGTAPVYPTPDPDALDASETVGTGTLDPAETPPTVTNPATGHAISVTSPLDDLKAHLAPPNSPLTLTELADLDVKGLDQFIVDLQARINATNDTLDFGFVRVQSDIYRHRQLMLDSVSASRLSVSPALAEIARGETAATTRDQLNAYLTAARQHQVGRVSGTPIAPAAAPAEASSPGLAAPALQALLPQQHALFLSGELQSKPELLTQKVSGTHLGDTVVNSDIANGTVLLQPIDTSVAPSPIQQRATLGVSDALHAHLVESGPTATQIEQQAPIVGKTLLFQQQDASGHIRTVTVADRLQQPAAPEAKSYTVATKAETYRGLASVPITIDDLAVPGFRDASNNELTRTFGTIKSNNFGSIGEIVTGIHDPDPAPQTGTTADEAAWLAAGVRTLEHTIAALRVVEGRVQAYQRIVNDCRLTISAMTDTNRQLDHQLKTIGDQLGQDRHDVATAQALLNDEQARVSSVNDRRTRILAEHVPFVAYQRPRAVSTFARGRLPAPGAPTVGVGAAGVLSGAYTYRVTFVTAQGETDGGTTTATITPAAQQVNLTAIPVGTPGCGAIARRIYRTVAGGADGSQRLLATLNDNTTVVFADNTPDASLGGGGVPRTNTSVSTPTVPVRGLEPVFVDTSVPDCLAEGETVPTEIQAMVDLLREAPLRWIVSLPPILQNIDRLEVLRGTLLQGAKQRAIARTNSVSFALPQPSSASMLAMGIASTYIAQQGVISQLRAATSRLDLSTFNGMSWQGVRDIAQDFVSVGDLIDVSHGRSDVSQAATAQLDRIARVATCLYTRLHNVAPTIRLVWAERLSQYDGPIDLSSLAQLPNWGSLDYLVREDMQSLADWLYQQVDPARPDARGIIHDLVRVCVLLASHAPVDEIIAGHVPHPTSVKPGGRVHLTVDESRVRIGMHVLLYSPTATDPVAHGIVEDLADGTAAARVLKTSNPTVSVDESARVRFLQPNTYSSSLVRTF